MNESAFYEKINANNVLLRQRLVLPIVLIVQQEITLG